MNNILKEINRIVAFSDVGINNIKKIHKGYEADGYRLIAGEEVFFVKYFFEKDTLKRELDGLRMLAEIAVAGIETPHVVGFTEKIILYKFADGLSFYDYLKTTIFNIREPVILFNKVGEYLAKLHNNNFIEQTKEGVPMVLSHGDVNSKNIIFLRNKRLLILDPKMSVNSIYRDISQFICNFYPYRFYYETYLFYGKKEFIKSFLAGYVENSVFSLDEETLNIRVADALRKDREYKKNNLSYKIKKIFINRYLNYLIKKIENGKLRIKLY